jgi:hypothetical protein
MKTTIRVVRVPRDGGYIALSNGMTFTKGDHLLSWNAEEITELQDFKELVEDGTIEILD